MRGAVRDSGGDQPKLRIQDRHGNFPVLTKCEQQAQKQDRNRNNPDDACWRRRSHLVFQLIPASTPERNSNYPEGQVPCGLTELRVADEFTTKRTNHTKRVQGENSPNQSLRFEPLNEALHRSAAVSSSASRSEPADEIAAAGLRHSRAPVHELSPSRLFRSFRVISCVSWFQMLFSE